MSGKRMLHDNICTSDKLNSVDEGSENLYYRFLSKTDDFGRFYGRPEIIKGYCYPLKNDITPEIVAERVKKLIKIGLFLKISDEVIEISDFNRYQKFRKDIKKKGHFRKGKSVTDTERVVSYASENVAISKDKISKVKIRKDNVSEASSDPRPFLKFFGDLWTKGPGNGKTYPANFGKEGKLVKDLLRIYDLESLSALAEKFFASNDRFITESGYTIGAFKSQIPKLIVAEKQEVREIYKAPPLDPDAVPMPDDVRIALDEFKVRSIGGDK